MICSACEAEVPDDDRFCEACGAALVSPAQPQTAEASACGCGAGAGDIDEDGYCLCCGKRVRRPASDHMEQSLGPNFAAVSDRGQRHDRNEDRFAVACVEDIAVLVVCDGVSSTRHSETASSLAATVIRDSLVAWRTTMSEKSTGEAMKEALRAAQERLRDEVVAGRQDSSPSTTAVAAVVREDQVTVGWVGDSRAYWIQEGVALPLTSDHSWLQETVSSGSLTRAEAESSPHAHAITRWLGADAEETAEPEVKQFPLQGAGVLLLCSDGLWNYAAEVEDLARVVAEAEQDGGEALSVAQRLVTFAKDQGGRDNITVALWRRPAEQVSLAPATGEPLG